VLKDVPPHLVRVASDYLDQLETSGDLLQATERAWARLHKHLTRQSGRPRGQALLVLALARARADVSTLAELTATRDGSLPPLHPALGQRPRQEVQAALVALLAHGLGLVAALEGRAAADHAARAVVCVAPHSKRFTRRT
jgi:hypothetical protein